MARHAGQSIAGFHLHPDLCRMIATKDVEPFSLERRFLMNPHVRKFQSIAPFYGLFFKPQVLYYSRIIEKHISELNLAGCETILDLGSGTGAFARCWQDLGYSVTAVDASPAMVRLCLRNGLKCLEQDVLRGLNFPDNYFDVVVGAYVAHGFPFADRGKLYRESARVAKDLVLFHDFGGKSRFFVSVIEKMEGSCYKEFISRAPGEMKEFFRRVDVLSFSSWNRWYICRP
jgi:SAM-dependent methyltransferase